MNYIASQEIALLDSLLEGIDNLEKTTKQMTHQEYDNVKSKAYLEGKVDALADAVARLEAKVDQLEVENQLLRNRIKEVQDVKEKPVNSPLTCFRLPENFSGYQQECDALLESLSIIYNIKKGKWGKDILQFILTPNNKEKTRQNYPSKWRWGLYLKPSEWAFGKVNYNDPDEWENFAELDIYEYADNNGIELT